MDLSGPGVNYILLMIPTLFALAVTGQGLYKIHKSEEDGKVVFGFGIMFFLLIIAAYIFFIR